MLRPGSCSRRKLFKPQSVFAAESSASQPPPPRPQQRPPPPQAPAAQPGTSGKPPPPPPPPSSARPPAPPQPSQAGYGAADPFAAGQPSDSPGTYGAPPVPPPPPTARPPPPRAATPPPPPPPSEQPQPHVRRPSYQQPIVDSMQEVDAMIDGAPARPSYETWGIDQPAPQQAAEEVGYSVPPMAPPAPPLPAQVCWRSSTGSCLFLRRFFALCNLGKPR